ncbi:MAG: histidine phosphatase family protein [Pirellulaceae bacterium]
MKTLLLLRHAKSSWKETDLDDHDRPLNERGKRDAPRIGALLREENLVPEYLVVSSAKRARKTAEHVIQQCGFRGEARITGELYEADRNKLLRIIAQLPEPLGRVLLIGHNPGLEELLESLTGRYAPLTTAALAHVELPIDVWSELAGEARATLVKVWQPRELD